MLVLIFFHFYIEQKKTNVHDKGGNEEEEEPVSSHKAVAWINFAISKTDLTIFVFFILSLWKRWNKKIQKTTIVKMIMRSWKLIMWVLTNFYSFLTINYIYLPFSFYWIGTSKWRWRQFKWYWTRQERKWTIK